MAGKKGRSGRKPNGEQTKRNIVYQITHVPTGRVYIGSTQHTLSYRVATHKARPSKAMMADLAVNGWDDFIVSVIGHYPNHTREELYMEERNAITQIEALGIPTYNTKTPGNATKYGTHTNRKWTPERKAQMSLIAKARVEANGRVFPKKQSVITTKDLAEQWGWDHAKVLAYLTLLEIPLRYTCKYVAKPKGMNHAITIQVRVAADPENFPLPTNPPDLSTFYPQYKGGNNA